MSAQLKVERADLEELRAAIEGRVPWTPVAKRLVAVLDARCGWCGYQPRVGQGPCRTCGRSHSDPTPGAEREPRSPVNGGLTRD